MKKLYVSLTLFACVLFFTVGSVHASDYMRGFRRQADSNYRIAIKAYRKAIDDYGESLQGFPAKEKESACKKFSSALHDNRTQINFEDTFGERKYRRQVKELEEYNSKLGCPR